MNRYDYQKQGNKAAGGGGGGFGKKKSTPKQHKMACDPTYTP
jgi:hypothetical protein